MTAKRVASAAYALVALKRAEYSDDVSATELLRLRLRKRLAFATLTEGEKQDALVEASTLLASSP